MKPFEMDIEYIDEETGELVFDTVLIDDFGPELEPSDWLDHPNHDDATEENPPW